MARNRLDPVPPDLAKLSTFRKYLRGGEHFRVDVEHGADRCPG